MKVTLTVECEDQDEARRFINGPKWAGVAWEFHQWMRSRRKHGEPCATGAEELEKVWDGFHTLLNDEGLSVYEE